MSGPRHEGWKHTRVIPPDARGYAAAFFPQALKVLGFAQQEAARQGLMTYKHQQQLDDGTVLTGEIVGGQPRMTIDVRIPLASGRRQQYRDDFVVWARDADRPGGIDPEHPQQILRPSWTTYFYSADTPGHEGFEGQKGTYIAMFPDGVKHAGNIDWRGAGEQRVSWYGPSTRYWLDPHVHPTRQYGKQVFMLGQVLFDAEAYLDASEDETFNEQWVMGAALPTPQTLLVVQAVLVPGETDDSPAPMNSSEITTPWPPGAVAIAVCRYAVGYAGPTSFGVVPGSRRVLWSGTLNRALNPWFFSEDANVAVSAGLPETVLLRRLHGAVLADPDTIEGVPPSPSSEMHTFTRTGPENGSMQSASVSLTGGAAVVAADFAGNAIRQMTVRRQRDGDLDAQFVFEHGDWSFAARSAHFELQEIAGLARATYRGHLGAIIHADLREGVVVTYRCDWFEVPNLPNVNTYREAVMIWHGASPHADIEIATGSGAAQNPMNTGFTRQLGYTRTGDRPIPRYDTVYSEIALSPMFAIYGHITQRQLEPRWDWTGAHGIYSFRAYPTTHWYGAAKVRTATANQVTRLDSGTDAGFESTGTDFDGKVIALSCATTDGITLFSGYGYEANRTAHFVTGGDLGALTGVDGQFARYHPAWLLGRPPAPLT